MLKTKESNVLNMTPHEIVIRKPDGTDRRVPASGLLARVATREVETGSVGGVPLVARHFGEVEIAQEAIDSARLMGSGGRLIVSSLVLEAAGRQRHPALRHLVAPDTGPTAVRDADGKIVAVTRLVKWLM